MFKKSTGHSAPDHFRYVEVVLILPLHKLTSEGFLILKFKSQVVV